MTVPVVNAFINFSTGPSFAQAMILDQGILGTNILGDSASIIVDVSNQINRIETKRGRNALIDQFQTGTLTLRIVDQNGDFNPQNPSSPYFSVLTPMKKVQITATYNSVTYPIFSGFITSYVTTYPREAEDVAYTTIQAVDAFRLAYNAQISTVTAATAGDLSGTRINQILDEIDEVSLSGAPLGIGALLKMAGLAPSGSEANRLIDGGGVRVDSSVVSDKGLKLEAGTYVVQVGKRKFARVHLSA